MMQSPADTASAGASWPSGPDSIAFILRRRVKFNGEVWLERYEPALPGDRVDTMVGYYPDFQPMKLVSTRMVGLEDQFPAQAMLHMTWQV